MYRVLRNTLGESYASTLKVINIFRAILLIIY